MDNKLRWGKGHRPGLCTPNTQVAGPSNWRIDGTGIRRPSSLLHLTKLARTLIKLILKVDSSIHSLPIHALLIKTTRNAVVNIGGKTREEWKNRKKEKEEKIKNNVNNNSEMIIREERKKTSWNNDKRKTKKIH